MPSLVTKGLSVSYGGVKALEGVGLEVPEGKLVGLIGPNGAGKTTCIDALTGFARCRGTVRLGDVELTGLPAYKRARLGMSRTFQSQELFTDLTVRENLLTAAHPPRWWEIFVDLVLPPKEKISGAVEDAIELLGLQDLLPYDPSELSLGQQKLVSVGRSLAAGPQFLLLDEPAAGLDTDSTKEFGKLLRRIVERGIGTLLVDHDMGLVLTACDYVYVLEFGKIIAEGTPAQIRTDPAVVQAYLGKQTLPEDFEQDAQQLLHAGARGEGDDDV